MLDAGKEPVRFSRLPPTRGISPMGRAIVVIASLAGALVAGGAMGYLSASLKDAALVACAVLVLEGLAWNRLLRQ